MAAEQIFTGLPKWAQGVLAVAGLGLITIIGFTIYNKIKKRVGLAGAFDEKKKVTSEIKTLADKGVKPSYSNAEYESMANKAFAAMDGYGSDDDALEAIMEKLKNDADVLKLIDAYGIRELDTGKFNPENNKKETLSGAISSEFSAGEIKDMNDILTKKGIKITF